MGGTTAPVLVASSSTYGGCTGVIVLPSTGALYAICGSTVLWVVGSSATVVSTGYECNQPAGMSIDDRSGTVYVACGYVSVSTATTVMTITGSTRSVFATGSVVQAVYAVAWTPGGRCCTRPRSTVCIV